MSLEFYIASDANIKINILRVYPTGLVNSNTPLAKPTTLQYLPYFAKLIPGAEYMTTDELTAYFNAGSWTCPASNKLTREQARALTPMLPVVCNECEFNKCVHLFPEIADDERFIEKFGAELFPPVHEQLELRYVRNSNMAFAIICAVRSDTPIKDVSQRMTAWLKRNHHYFVTLCTSISKRFSDIDNDMLNAEIDRIEPNWEYGTKIHRTNVNERIICMFCRPKEICCHVFPEKRDPALCSRAFCKKVENVGVVEIEKVEVEKVVEKVEVEKVAEKVVEKAVEKADEKVEEKVEEKPKIDCDAIIARLRYDATFRRAFRAIKHDIKPHETMLGVYYSQYYIREYYIDMESAINNKILCHIDGDNVMFTNYHDFLTKLMLVI